MQRDSQEDGAVQFLKSKIAIKQHENVDIFVTNIKKYKQTSNVKQLVDEFEVEEWRTRNRDTRAVVEEQSGLSSPYKRLKMSSNWLMNLRWRSGGQGTEILELWWRNNPAFHRLIRGSKCQN